MIRLLKIIFALAIGALLASCRITVVGGMPAVYLKGLLSGYAWTGDEEIIGNVYQNPDLLEVIK